MCYVQDSGEERAWYYVTQTFNVGNLSYGQRLYNPFHKMSQNANLTKKRFKTPNFKRSTLRNVNPLFHERQQEEDDVVLSPQLLKLARKTGGLNLSARGLAKVPEKIYDINQPDADAPIKLADMTVDEDEAWWNQVPLNNLDLSSNSLTHLSPKIENLNSLTTLTLHDNALVCIPKEIGKLEKLTRINLSHNKLKILPHEFFTLPEVRYLNLSHNDFDELHPDISDLHMLEFLDVSHNNIQTLPCGIGFLVRLTVLLLSFNQIKELPPDFVNMRSLQKLDLMQNELIELPEDIGSLRKLLCIYVQHNDIQKLPDFDGCEDLQELHASNNFLESISKAFCSKLPHLKVLDVRDNKITQLPDEICYLRNLTRLDVSNNSITTLPLTLSTLAHLISLQVEGNPIKSIRRDILQCGTTRILKTLHDRAQTRLRDKESSTSGGSDNIDVNTGFGVSVGIGSDATASQLPKMVGDGLNSPRLQGGRSVVDDNIYPDNYNQNLFVPFGGTIGYYFDDLQEQQQHSMPQMQMPSYRCMPEMMTPRTNQSYNMHGYLPSYVQMNMPQTFIPAMGLQQQRVPQQQMPQQQEQRQFYEYFRPQLNYSHAQNFNMHFFENFNNYAHSRTNYTPIDPKLAYSIIYNQ